MIRKHQGNQVHKTFFVTLCCLSLLVSSRVHAAVCYSPQEAAADAALRFQAELRITGLSCKLQNGESLFSDYQKFAADNQALLQTYQDRLLAFYKAHNKGNATTRLHTRETDIENDLELSAAKQGIGEFCQTHSAALQNAVVASDAEVQRQIETYAAAHPASIKICSPPPSR